MPKPDLEGSNFWRKFWLVANMSLVCTTYKSLCKNIRLEVHGTVRYWYYEKVWLIEYLMRGSPSWPSDKKRVTSQHEWPSGPCAHRFSIACEEPTTLQIANDGFFPHNFYALPRRFLYIKNSIFWSPPPAMTSPASNGSESSGFTSIPHHQRRHGNINAW